MGAGNIKANLSKYIFVVSRYDSLADALTDIGATECQLNVDTDCTKADGTAWPTNIKIFWAGGKITCESNYTIGEFLNDPQYQIFDGAGVVSGISRVRPEWFGAVGNRTTDDSDAIIAACASISATGGGVVYCEHKYYVTKQITVPNGVKIKGAGIDKTIFDLKTNMAVNLFVTETPTITVLTQTANLNISDTSNAIENEAAANDIVEYLNTAQITEEWYPGAPIPGRSYYQKGELFKIKSATGSVITFTEAAIFYLPVSTTAGVRVFTPNTGIEFTDFTVTRNSDTTSNASSINVYYCDGAIVKNVRSENANDSGIQVSESFNTQIHNCNLIGGTEDLGLNYGLSIVKGSKHTNATNITASHCRHGVTGTTGTIYNSCGIPAIYANINNLNVSNSQEMSFDCHGSSCYFSYNNCAVDNGFAIGGIGHSVTNVRSASGPFYIYEGGTDQHYENIYFATCEQFYANYKFIRVKFVNVTLNLRNMPTAEHYQIPEGSSAYEFINCKILNRDIESAADNAGADATIYDSAASKCGIYLQARCKAINTKVSGFPIGIQLFSSDCVVDNCIVENCAWDSSLTGTKAAIYGTLKSQGSVIRNLQVNFNLTNLTNASNYIIQFTNTTDGVATGKKIIIDHIYHGAAHTQNYVNGLYFTNGYTDITVMNTNIDVTTNSIAATGTYVNNKIATSTYLDNYFKGTTQNDIIKTKQLIANEDGNYAAFVNLEDGELQLAGGGGYGVVKIATYSNQTADFAYTSKSDDYRYFVVPTFATNVAIPQRTFTIGANTYTVVFSKVYLVGTDEVRIYVKEAISGESATGTLTAVPYAEVRLMFYGYEDVGANTRTMVVTSGTVTKLLNTTDATAPDTGSFQTKGGAYVEKQIIGAGGAKLGDGGTTNYAEIKADGEINLHGTAKYVKYTHLEFDHTRTAAQSKPTEVFRGVTSGFSLPIYNTDDEELFACACIDPSWDGTTDPVIKLSVWLASAEDVNDDFNLQVSVETFDPLTNEVVPTSTNDYAVETNVTVGTQYASYFVTFTLDASAIGLVVGQPLGIRIRRLAAAGTEIAGEVVVHGAVIGWTCDKFGYAT